MNSYYHIKRIKDLNKTINEEQEEINTFKHNQENMINEKDYYKNLIIQMDAWIKFLEQNHGNDNINLNNEKDKNNKEKKNMLLFCQTKLNIVVDENDK